jgi:uncharacterized Zn finger protein (UPF0148 family)
MTPTLADTCQHLPTLANTCQHLLEEEGRLKAENYLGRHSYLERKTMAEKICRQCGSALTKAGAKFCTICGATVEGAETTDIESQETRALPDEQTGQGAFATNVLPAQTPLSYATEEMPQVSITAKAEEMATEVIEIVGPAPVAQPIKKQAEPAPAKQPPVQSSGGRKKSALAAALGVVALVAAGAFFFVNSRKAPESQSEIRPADSAGPVASAQPAAQPSNQQADQQSGAGASNQAQSQTRPQVGAKISDVKSPAVRSDAATSNPQQQAAATPTPAAPEISAAEHQKQGIAYMNSGRHQEALREYDYVRKLDPDNKDVYYLIGLTYWKMNQLGQALEAYRQCTSGVYVSEAHQAVGSLEKQLKKVNAR